MDRLKYYYESFLGKLMDELYSVYSYNEMIIEKRNEAIRHIISRIDNIKDEHFANSLLLDALILEKDKYD
jgi:hypothetical protein